jgi:hypothetical protein
MRPRQKARFVKRARFALLDSTTGQRQGAVGAGLQVCTSEERLPEETVVGENPFRGALPKWCCASSLG